MSKEQDLRKLTFMVTMGGLDYDVNFDFLHSGDEAILIRRKVDEDGFVVVAEGKGYFTIYDEVDYAHGDKMFDDIILSQDEIMQILTLWASHR